MNRSERWSIEDPRINCSLMTLSSRANAEFDKLLASSGILVNATRYATLQSSRLNCHPRHPEHHMAAVYDLRLQLHLLRNLGSDRSAAHWRHWRRW